MSIPLKRTLCDCHTPGRGQHSLTTCREGADALALEYGMSGVAWINDEVQAIVDELKRQGPKPAPGNAVDVTERNADA